MSIENKIMFWALLSLSGTVSSWVSLLFFKLGIDTEGYTLYTYIFSILSFGIYAYSMAKLIKSIQSLREK